MVTMKYCTLIKRKQQSGLAAHATPNPIAICVRRTLLFSLEEEEEEAEERREAVKPRRKLSKAPLKDRPAAHICSPSSSSSSIL